MKKSFYFALALTAGLFASCSSDDLTADAPGGAIDVNDNDAVQINVNVDDPTQYTRGTGSVTGTKWGGQTFNLFMFNRGTFDPAQYDAAPEGSEEEDMQDIYNNAVMTTTPGTSIAQQVIDAENHIQYQYFPTIGRFSFWAYRADDAADMTDGDDPQPIVKYTDATGADAEGDVATQVRIPFTIDGTQDLMVAETNTEAAKNKLMELEGLDEDDAADYVYSAYAARRDVNPTMKFYHQLTRLQFKVKAANRQASNQADILADGEDYIRGIKVSKVEVWSKSTGSLIVAYKGEDPGKRIVWNDGQNWEAKATFDPENTTLTPFELKSRDSDIDPADILWFEIPKTMEEASAALTAAVPEHYTLQALGGENPCYLHKAFDAETNMPTAAAGLTKFSTVADNDEVETVWVLAVKDGDHGDADETPWSEAIIKEDVTGQLGDLVEVVPEWTGYNNTAGWSVYPPVATAYDWDEIAYADLTDDQKSDLKELGGNVAPGENTSGYDEGDVVHVLINYVDKYYILNDITYDTDDVDESTDDFNSATAGRPDDLNTIIRTGEGTDEDPFIFYKYHEAGSVTAEGKAVATPIGESMMVAPADDKGYIVRFTYWRSVLKTNKANDFVNRKGEAIINVKVKETANAGTEYEGMFMPGKVYTVTAVFYPDGIVKLQDGDIDEEGDGTNDLDGDVDEDGDVTYSTEN